MRHLLFSLCFLFTLTLPCHAQGQKPNTLSAKEIADGWILLFDGETTFGWKAEGEPLKIDRGILQIGGDRATKAQPTALFSSYELKYEYSIKAHGEGKKGTSGGFHFEAAKITYGGRPFKGENAVWQHAKFKVDRVKGSFQGPGNDDGFFVLKAMDFANPNWITDANCLFLLKNVKLRPLTTKSIFNAKDLTGWKEFPGKKSKFAIIDGAINVKDGPGDLQTVGKYKDFILQLECISNGKHLNSGIFFRCRDNEYQNGYEAQIRNEFKAEPQKYLVEEYDPKTNKLVAKKEVLSNAFDFGTGAIYRRVPARKQMSKDNEWFGMTIVANGNHLATWVNGIQVTDWYDHRPKSDNARTGCKLDAGHISIQGHDPTTDLSFKNFRIAELK